MPSLKAGWSGEQGRCLRNRGKLEGVSTKKAELLFGEWRQRYEKETRRDAVIVFDGLDEGDLRKIVFVEVKSGKSMLSRREGL